MKKYIVMCCRDGEMQEPNVQDTFEFAYKSMKTDYEIVLGWNPDLDSMLHEINDEEDFVNGLAVGAWIEDNEHQTYWGIAEIEF